MLHRLNLRSSSSTAKGLAYKEAGPFASLLGYGLHRNRQPHFFFGFFTSTSTSTLPPPGVRTVFLWPGFTLTFFTFVTSAIRSFCFLV